MTKKILTIFYILIFVFGLILAQFFIPLFREILAGSIIFLIPMLIFCILGLWLAVLVFKSELAGWLKRFLILSGLGPIGLFVGTVAHNIFYALAELSHNIKILVYIFNFIHVSFFLLSVIVCPLAFLVGVIGAIYLLVKKKYNLKFFAKNQSIKS